MSSDLSKLLARMDEFERNSFDYRLHINLSCFWSKPPEDHKKKMHRQDIEYEINMKIYKFLDDVENRTNLLNKIFSG